MQSGRLKQVRESVLVTDTLLGEGDAILVIGEVSQWRARGRALPETRDIHCIEFHELTAELIELLQPKAVLSPLLCASFDCLDVAVLLQEINYRGRYRAMSTSLPNPWLILAEISESCPDIDFDIVKLGETGVRLN